MPDPTLITIDHALAELDRLRATLCALRLMPKSMPKNPVDLAMTAALRGLNFTEAEKVLGPAYVTDDVAGFDQVEVCWSDQYAFTRNMIVVRVIGQKRFKTVPGYDSVAAKIIEIPRGCVGSPKSPSLSFADQLFEMIACPEHFWPITEDYQITAKPMEWPKIGMAFWWDEGCAALAKQKAKGGRPPIVSALVKPDAVEMTPEERKACELLDKGKFF
jgi:hypothetical protein